MSALEVRPSTKFLIFGFVLEAIMLAGAIYLWKTMGDQYKYALAVPILLGIYTSALWAVKSSTRIWVADGRLRYQSGIASKTTRTLELARIQDVTVRQALTGRLLGLGSITIVTASETGSLTMDQIDSPQRVAETILDLARHAR